MAKKKPIVSKEGQWKYPGQETIIPNVNGRITMQGVPYPVLGIDDQGYSQMMMPGEEYQFPGNSVYEIPMAKNGGTKKVKIHSLPKAQNGGRGPATFQDSLDVANSAQQVIDWYKSQGYYGGSGVGDKEPARSREGVRMISMDKAKGAANKPISKTPITIGGRTTIGQKDDLGNGGLTIDLPKFEVTLPSVSSLGEVGSMALAGTLNAIGGIQNLTNENLAEWESPYRFRQYADDHKRILNTDAPKALYDTRIDPRSTFILQGTAPGYFSGNADVVDMPIYEKFYTAPWSVLSPEDKRKRLEFGILDGTPFKDWNDPGLIQNYPDIALANGGRRAQGYDEQTIKNAAASGYAPTQEGAAQYEKNKWAKNPRVYDAQTIANAVKSGYPATQSGAAEYELNNWQKKSNSKNSIARKEPNPNTDIAHYMKTELGLDKKQTSYSERKKLAEKYGIKDYSGSAKQNIELLNKIKSEEDPADAVRRMLAGEKLNTVLPIDSQPEDFKVPYKGDPNRRSYPIELSGDAAIDNMRQQLFGNLGKFTDNGKIPLDDPKYNPYVGGIGPRTPQKEMQRIAIPPGGFAYGGQLPMAQRGMTANIQDKKNVIYNDLDEYNKAHQAEGDSLLAATNTYVLLDHLNQVARGQRFFDGSLQGSIWRNDPASKLYYNSLQNKYIKPTSNRLVNVSPTNSNVSGTFPVYNYDFPETHAVYEELPKPLMKEPILFPSPTVDIKPQLQNIERPKSTKQRVIINTPEGDKIRVQDIRTKKFIDWEETDGAPVDIENPTGTASQDFVYPEPKVIKTPKFNYGGDLPKAQNGKNILYVDSKKDPAYKAYSDSLNLYKAMIMQDKLMGSNTTNDPYINARRAGSNKSPLSDFTVKSLKEGRIPRLVPGLEHLGPIARDFDNAAELKDFANSIGSKNDIKLVDYYKSLGFNDNNIMYHTSADVVHPKIKPVDSYWDGSAWSPVYKKPRREVIVQKVPDNVPAINTPTQLVSQPEDIKIPLKADLTRRQYPIALTGDAALDRLNQQLYGNFGALTDDGYIPTDDPKYYPYKGMGPGTPAVRRSYGKFANGGDISIPDLRRVKIHALPNNWKSH